MITPTVGRVVWYHPGRDQHITIDNQPCAALICFVYSDTKVNLVVFDHYGAGGSRQAVELCQGETAPGGCEYCEWMPYQKGQAAKTEALESLLGPNAKITPPEIKGDA